ncbi:MAG TPA: HlyD family secretion protein [Burkholderiales bacterium]|nr:HlyD family secretion protein [Burkholderiales bacterium]
MDQPKPEVLQKPVPVERRRTLLRSRAKAWLIGLAVLAMIAYAASWVVHRWTHIYVDDARIDGEVVTISSRVSGWIAELPVIEGDEVKKDQVIARIDDRDSRLQREVLEARLKTVESQMGVIRAQSGQVDLETAGRYQAEASRIAAAQAEVAAAEAHLKQAQQDRDRSANVHAKGYISDQEMERARTAVRQAEEARRKALAEVAAAKSTLSAASGSRKQLNVMQQQLAVLASQAAEIRTEIQRHDVDLADRAIKAPADGRIVMTFARKGEHVAAGQRIAMFHDPKQVWVEANVRETAIGQLKPGMPAEVKVDAYPGRVFHGEIYRIGQAATSKFALLPDPNPSGNFTKITQRLPVRILLQDKDLTLRPGMMVEVEIPIRNN